MNVMGPAVRIVRMHGGHIQAIAQLERRCFSTPWSAQSLQETLENPLAALFVAELDGMPVGYAGVTYVLDEGYILNVAVLPEYRRRGIATALLGRIEDFALDKGLSMLTLEVRRSNNEAISLYQRRGFKEAGTRRGFYINPREDALIMTKYLQTRL